MRTNRRLLYAFKFSASSRAVQARGILSNHAFFRGFEVQDGVRLGQRAPFVRFFLGHLASFANHTCQGNTLHRSGRVFNRITTSNANCFRRVLRINAAIFIKQDACNTRRSFSLIRTFYRVNYRVRATNLLITIGRLFGTKFMSESSALFRIYSLFNVCIGTRGFNSRFYGADANSGPRVAYPSSDCFRSFVVGWGLQLDISGWDFKCAGIHRSRAEGGRGTAGVEG